MHLFPQLRVGADNTKGTSIIIHFPREIISTVGKIGQDAQQNRKWSWKLCIHISMDYLRMDSK